MLMKFSTTRLALLVSALLLAFGSVGCQTSKGFGEDVENLGENIKDVAN